MTNREIDAEIAEKVFGCKVQRGPIQKYQCGCPGNQHRHYLGGNDFSCELPNYSTNIRDAWEVVEKLNQQVDIRYNFKGDRKTFVTFLKGNRGWHHYYSLEESAPLAICKSALKAVAA